MKNYLKYVIILPIIIVSFAYNLMKPSALTTTTIYSDNTNGTLTNSNKFLYSPSNLGLLFDSSTGSINTKYDTACYGMQFWFSQAITTSNTYTIQLNFNDYDVYESVSTNYVQVYVYNNEEPTQASLLSVTKTNKSTQYKTLIIKYVSSVPGTKVRVRIEKANTDGFFARIYGPLNFRLNSVQVDSSQAEGNEQIIINNNQNTQNIINNQEQNTQNIIDNQNQNTQDLIDAQKVCKDALLYKGFLSNTSIFANNNLVYFERYTGLKTFIYESSENKTYSFKFKNYNRLRVYESNTLYTDSDTPFNISGTLLIDNSSPTVDATYQINTTKKYIYFSLSNTSSNTGEIEIEQVCVNGNQAVSDSINDLNDTINDDSVGGATSDAGDFITGFDTNTFGLTSIITAPLNLIQSLTSSSCSQLELPLPYLNNKKLILPCMTTIYQSTFGSLFTMYQTITFGIIAYWVCVRIFNMVKDFKNPDHDEVEVVDL